MNRTTLALLAAIAVLVVALVLAVVVKQNSPADRLAQAAAKGEPAEIKRVLASGVDVNQPAKTGESALVIAARNGKAENVKVLLQKGAHRDSRDAALVEAVRGCHVECVQLLLSGGANGKVLTQPGGDGNTALSVAAKSVKPGPPTPCSEVVRVLSLAGIREPAASKP